MVPLGASGAEAQVWTPLGELPENVTAEAWVQPAGARCFALDEKKLRDQLSGAPMGIMPDAVRDGVPPVVVILPDPNGKFHRFEIEETVLMAPELAAQFPGIKTYQGHGVDDPGATVKLDLTPKGFHAQILTPSGSFYIDPAWKTNTPYYSCYRKDDAAGKNFQCLCTATFAGLPQRALRRSRPGRLSTGTTLRTYRLAVAAQGEYTQFHGGTVAGGLAAVVTTINRVNGIFERDLAVRLQLVANNNLIIYTNAATDPYSVNSATSAVLVENQANLDAVIGSANYDVGHVFNSSEGGLAAFGVVCDNAQKAEGGTGAFPPTGDAFDVSFVAHELGHQFGADHSFNGSVDACGGNARNGPTAFERGSGSTIMSYAGICDTDDLQANADAYFHATSLSQINAFLATTSCAVSTATGNTPPSVSAGADFTIPMGTPFTLNASGSDAEGDNLTYCWEQMDLGPQEALSGSDSGSGPLFRSFLPTTDPSRTFPRLGDILSNTSNNAEVLPTTNRLLNFRVTARDNRVGGGGTGSDDMAITVIAGAGPFAVTFPNTAVSISGMQTVTWNNASTQNAPVDTPNVNIRMSIDGGANFDLLLAENVPNDGTHSVTLPNINSSQCRVKIEGAGNIFFDVSDVNFTVMPAASTPFFVDGLGHVVNDTLGTGNENGGLDPGESGIQLTLNIENDSLSPATGVSATLTSLTPTATVVSGVASYPDLAAGQTAANLSPFVIDLSPDQACGAPVNLRLTVNSNEGLGLFDLALPTGTIGTPVTRSFSASTLITGGTIDTQFTIADQGAITDLDFRFDGSVASTDPASALVGLNHGWVGDLTVTLISPSGTEVILINRPGGGAFGSSGNNFHQTLLDDDGAFPSIQSIAVGGGDAPHTGTWNPANSLSGFDGESAVGTWSLRINDGEPMDDDGRLNAFSLIFTFIGCTPPSPTNYEDWITASGIAGNDALFAADSNDDGIANGVAFYLGAPDANVNAIGFLGDTALVSQNEIDYLKVTFPRTDQAADLKALVRHSENLRDWSGAVDGEDGVIVTVKDDEIATGVDEIEVLIPLNGASRLYQTILISP